MLRAVRPDGLVIQPDRPVSFVDAMFSPSFPHGSHIWGTYADVELEFAVAPLLRTFYVLSIDVSIPFQLSERDLYAAIKGTTEAARWSPRMAAKDGWLARRWFKSSCINGSAAVASGCVLPPISSAATMPEIINDRGIVVQNDSHTFDIHTLYPILDNGWVLLGDLERYVSLTSKRFLSASAAQPGDVGPNATLVVSVLGMPAEVLRLTALKPTAAHNMLSQDWEVVVHEVRFDQKCKLQLVTGLQEPVCIRKVDFSVLWEKPPPPPTSNCSSIPGWCVRDGTISCTTNLAGGTPCLKPPPSGDRHGCGQGVAKQCTW